MHTITATAEYHAATLPLRDSMIKYGTVWPTESKRYPYLIEKNAARTTGDNAAQHYDLADADRVVTMLR